VPFFSDGLKGKRVDREVFKEDVGTFFFIKMATFFTKGCFGLEKSQVILRGEAKALNNRAEEEGGKPLIQRKGTPGMGPQICFFRGGYGRNSVIS